MSDAIDKVATKLVEITDKLQGAGVEIALAAARTEALSCLVMDAIIFVGGALLARKGWRAFKSDPDCDSGFTLAWIIAGSCGAFFGVIGGIMLCDPWLYVTMVHPEQWIAKKALKL